jgi:uncharacterized lipoprotein YddW (UPF0748 family)
MRRVLAVVAFALLTSPAPAADRPQFRAVWVDAFGSGFKTPEQVQQLIADLKSMNCNAVVAQVRKRGDALFRKSVEPFAEDHAIPEGFDPLAALLDAAHKEGIQVHAWVNVSTIWPGDAAPPKSPDHVFNRNGPGTSGRDDWLSRDDAGNVRFGSGHFVDPGHPDYAEHFTRVVRELVRNYAVDGVHFDYVRYSETEGDLARGYGAGYNPTNVERFNRAHGRTGTPDRGDPLWKDWRRRQVTHLVRRVRVALLEEKPDVALSAALIPWGAGPADEEAWFRSAPYNRVFQDWHAWRTGGLLDLIIPMNYDREANPAQKQYFDQWISFEKRFRGRALAVVGVGAYMNSVPDTANQVRRSLAPLGEVPGADGVCFFSYASLRRDRDKSGDADLGDLRKHLTDGEGAPFARPAELPKFPRQSDPLAVIAGRATGAGGQPLDAAVILVEPADGGPALRCLTDGNGHFAAVGVPPGKYRVAVPVRGAAKPEVVDAVAGRVVRVAE